MKGICKILFGSIVVILGGCGGDDTANMSIVNASIVDYTLEECFCCSSVTLEFEGSQYTVDDFPGFDLEMVELPKSVVVELDAYKGNCPSRQYSVLYHD